MRNIEDIRVHLLRPCDVLYGLTVIKPRTVPYKPKELGSFEQNLYTCKYFQFMAGPWNNP